MGLLQRTAGLLRRKLGLLVRGTGDPCCCTFTGDWIEIVNVCDPDDKYYLTLAECEAIECETTDLTYGGQCYGPGDSHFDETTTLPHFPGTVGECAPIGCFDLILSFTAAGENCDDPPIEACIRVPGSTYPGYFALDGCGSTLAPWEGKVGVICPATIDLEPCHEPGDPVVCYVNGTPPEFLPVKSPRVCFFHGAIDTICANADDPECITDGFDPDEFTWYEDVGTEQCCYENDEGAYPCLCDEL